MTEITSKPDHGDIVITEGRAAARFQLYLDDLTQRLNDNLLGVGVKMASYIVADLPSASENLDVAIIVSDETGGRTIATSDSTNWRRVSDGAVVS